MIPVTKPYLPNREKLEKYIDGIYERNWLTNNGPLLQELTNRLKQYLGVENLLLVSNGTTALQIAYRVLGVHEAADGASPEAITTPFTFIATASSLKWDGIKPVFADIDPETWCLDPGQIESAITERTRAIVPVHVFGNGCNVESIHTIAKQYGLKVIYDASHAFGVDYRGESLLLHGDAATLSFHATKLFHTVEGGAIVFKSRRDLECAEKMINFGLSGPESIGALGINGKMNELQAAMGLCVLDEIQQNLQARKSIWNHYQTSLKELIQLQVKSPNLTYNYAYFPAVFESQDQAMKVAARLKKNDILARRYFYPSLDSVRCLGAIKEQPVSSDIASRVLCLPIFSGLSEKSVELILEKTIEVL